MLRLSKIIKYLGLRLWLIVIILIVISIFKMNMQYRKQKKLDWNIRFIDNAINNRSGLGLLQQEREIVYHKASHDGQDSKVNESENLLCEPVELRKSEVSLPVTGLVSYPGAGNTWTRHLLQQVSG